MSKNIYEYCLSVYTEKKYNEKVQTESVKPTRVVTLSLFGVSLHTFAPCVIFPLFLT